MLVALEREQTLWVLVLPPADRLLALAARWPCSLVSSLAVPAARVVISYQGSYVTD